MKVGNEIKARIEISGINLPHKRITTAHIRAPFVHRDLITKKLLCFPDAEGLRLSLFFLCIVKVFHTRIVLLVIRKNIK
jgi:hypothetical protein